MSERGRRRVLIYVERCAVDSCCDALLFSGLIESPSMEFCPTWYQSPLGVELICGQRLKVMVNVSSYKNEFKHYWRVSILFNDNFTNHLTGEKLKR